MDPYSTHIHVLATALMRTYELFPTLSILECGCGDYSTPMIANMARGREHVIMSSDPEWRDRYLDVANVKAVEPADKHQWGEVRFEGWWGLVFMDSEELVKYRARHIPKLLEIAEVVVMHDARDDVDAYLRHARYAHMWKGAIPWTWIGSNTIDVRTWFI